MHVIGQHDPGVHLQRTGDQGGNDGRAKQVDLAHQQVAPLLRQAERGEDPGTGGPGTKMARHGRNTRPSVVNDPFTTAGTFGRGWRSILIAAAEGDAS